MSNEELEIKLERTTETLKLLIVWMNNELGKEAVEALLNKVDGII